MLSVSYSKINKIENKSKCHLLLKAEEKSTLVYKSPQWLFLCLLL